MAGRGLQCKLNIRFLWLLVTGISVFVAYFTWFPRQKAKKSLIIYEKPIFRVEKNASKVTNAELVKLETRGNLTANPNKNWTETKSAELFPEMDLYLRMTSGKLYYFYDALLTRSMKYFWPGNVPMVVVLDDENAEDHKLGEKIAREYPFPRVAFMESINPEIYHVKGHERVQRDFFYPEKFVSRPYVGFIDTDTAFVTRVTRNLLFEDDKPVVIGIYGESVNEWWADASKLTASIFKSSEPFQCMSFFPVIIKVEHIIELRKYLEKVYDMSFDAFFKLFSRNNFVQFNLMCKYIWDFHRNEYHFHLQLRLSSNDGMWSGARNGGGRYDIQYYRRVLTEKQSVPKPRATIHYLYRIDVHLNTTLQEVLYSGICYSGGFEICPEKCSKWKPDGLHKDLFVFEWSDWTWDNRCITEQIEHYKQIKAQSNSELRETIRKGCDEIDHIEYKPIFVKPG